MAKRQLHIDKEAVATLRLLEDGLLYPAVKLMNEEESKEVDKTRKYNGITYPFSFILAPAGKTNEEVLKSISKDEQLDLVCDGEICGNITANGVFEINIIERIVLIYGTTNEEHPGVKDTLKRLGKYAIYGDFTVKFDDIKKNKQIVAKAIEDTDAKKISAMMLSGKPFHRVHERLIRTALVSCDLMVIFVLKPYTNDVLKYETRYKTLEYFCEHYLPQDKVVLIPLENTYIFGGFNELTLDVIVAKNFGCTKIIVGQNHAGLGAFYTHGSLETVIDNIDDIGIEIDIMSEFVYCDKCSTLVSTNACPHGRHHHINYNSSAILELLEMGILPPAILMRKEISSIILCDLFPNRLEKLNKIQQQLFPQPSLLDDFQSKHFYESLIDLYKTSSLT